jgi:hypothetical protein
MTKGGNAPFFVHPSSYQDSKILQPLIVVETMLRLRP